MKNLLLILSLSLISTLLSCNSNTHNNFDGQSTKTYTVDNIQAGEKATQQVIDYQIVISKSDLGTTMFVIKPDYNHPIVFPVNIYMKVDSIEDDNIYSFNYMDNLTYRFHIKQ